MNNKKIFGTIYKSMDTVCGNNKNKKNKNEDD